MPERRCVRSCDSSAFASSELDGGRTTPRQCTMAHLGRSKHALLVRDIDMADGWIIQGQPVMFCLHTTKEISGNTNPHKVSARLRVHLQLAAASAGQINMGLFQTKRRRGLPPCACSQLIRFQLRSFHKIFTTASVAGFIDMARRSLWNVEGCRACPRIRKKNST